MQNGTDTRQRKEREGKGREGVIIIVPLPGVYVAHKFAIESSQGFKCAQPANAKGLASIVMNSVRAC